MAKRNPRSVAPDSPGPAEREEQVMRWIGLAIQEGVSQNKAEHSYDHIGAGIDAIMGIDEPRIRSPKLSHARFNKLQKIALELRALLTDIKPFWTYSTNADRYQRQADIFGKLSKSWFLRRGIDQVFRDTIDYVLVAGTGYIHLFFNPDIPGPTDRTTGITTQGDIDAVAEDPRDCGMIRFQGGDKRTMQNARGAWVRRERPIDYYPRVYGEDNPAVKAIKIDRYGYEKESPSARRLRETEEALMSEGAPNAALFGGPPAQSIGGKIPVTDEFTIYLHDFSVNESKVAKEMGPWADDPDEPGTRMPASPWSYIAEPGERLYPFGRRIVATRYGILEDGPGQFHHGMLPVCKVTLDTWAWARWGTSPIHPLLSLQRDADETLRAIQDHIRRAAKRNFVYDKKAISPNLAKGFNTRLSGMQLGVNPGLEPGKAFQIIPEPALDQAVPEHLKFLLESMDEISGVANLRGLAELNQMPSGDTIEQLIQAMTPLVRARSRSLEVFIREFAMMLASMFMQFYPLELRLRLLGADGMTWEDWDYKPGDLLPDFISDEDYETIDVDAPNGGHQKHTRIRPEAYQRGPDPEHVRNKQFLQYFNFDVAEGTLLDVATTSKRMFYLQGARMGLIDHWTLLEVWGVPNVGKPPSWANTITDRLIAEKLMGLGIMASTAGRSPSGQAPPSFTNTGAISES